MDGYPASRYGARFAAVYAAWYADISDPDRTAAFVAARCRGTLLELG